MFEQVKTILAKQLRKDASSITMDTDIKKDLGADSLSLMELVLTIEEDYSITFPDEVLPTIVTVRDVVNFLESQKN